VERFEKEFAITFQAVDAVAFPYGRSAQWAFFKAMGIENAEIIMPAYTCSVVAHGVTLSDNMPRFIDITLDDYNMNLDEAEAAINERTRAIIATHTFGYPQDLDRLEAMVRRAEDRYGHKIWLMQDCCHAFGAEWNGRMIGTSGDVAVYAFNISKIMTSIFGGMLTFQDKKIATKVRDWRDAHFKTPGWGKGLSRRAYLLSAALAFQTKIYGFTHWLHSKTRLLDRLTKAYHLDGKIGFPPDSMDKMLNVEASVGLVQLKKYPSIVAHRREAAARHERLLPKNKHWAYPPLVPGATYSHYTLLVHDRKAVQRYFAQKNIEAGDLIQYSIPDLGCYANCAQHCPNASLAASRTVNVPLNNL
jgi:dTDP-4-amino-4,6-dideoxygalactose transaminase